MDLMAIELDDQLNRTVLDIEHRLPLLARAHRVRVRTWLAKLQEAVSSRP